ncbi:MAG: ABC transporter substrate-binding protein [Christensenellales bacterium]
MKKFICLLLGIVFSITLVACQGPPQDSDGVFVDDETQHYTIKYYMPYLNMGAVSVGGLDEVVDAVNEITEREINASVEIVAYPYWEYTQRMTNVIATSEKFDICHTSVSINHYMLNVQRKAFYPLDYLLKTYAPVTLSQIDEEVWQQVKVNGKTYATINAQILPRTFSMYVNDKRNVEAFLEAKYPGKTFDTAYTIEKHKLALIEEYLLWLKENNKGKGGITTRIDTVCTLQNLYGFDDLSTGMGAPGVVKASDDLKDGKLTVVNQFKTDEYKEMLNYAKKWKAIGLIPRNASSIGQDPNELDLVYSGTWKPGTDTVVNGVPRSEWRLSDPTYFQSFILGTMNAISTRSENPARAMKFIELMSSNKELHNLLQFGIEGRDYEFEAGSTTRIKPLDDSMAYDNRNFGWGLGSEFNSYLQPNQPDDLWQQVKTINDTARKPSVIGFNFDPTRVKQKIADCLAVFEEYGHLLSEAGYPDMDKAYEEFISALDAAGAEEIIAEKQRQLDIWVAEQLKN